MSIGLLGKKLGMTRLYDEKGRLTTATVIEAGGNRVLQVKTAEKDGYDLVVQEAVYIKPEYDMTQRVIDQLK